jgi:hypothetical protein
MEGAIGCGIQLLEHLEVAARDPVLGLEGAIKGAREAVIATHQVVPFDGELIVDPDRWK